MKKFIFWLKSVFGGRLWAILTKIFDKAKTEAFLALEGLARDVIIELSTLSITNDEKRRAAFEKIKYKALAKGISVKDSFINFIIETVYQELKG
jgi:hypothetical protein